MNSSLDMSVFYVRMCVCMCVCVCVCVCVWERERERERDPISLAILSVVNSKNIMSLSLEFSGVFFIFIFFLV